MCRWINSDLIGAGKGGWEMDECWIDRLMGKKQEKWKVDK